MTAPSVAGGVPYLETGPASFTASVTVPPGALVEPDGTTGKVRPASAGSKSVLGYAVVPGTPPTLGTDLFQVARPSRLSVYRQCVAWLNYSADAHFGDYLIADAGGAVKPAGASPDPTTIVGQCYEPAGVASGGIGRTWVK